MAASTLLLASRHLDRHRLAERLPPPVLRGAPRALEWHPDPGGPVRFAWSLCAALLEGARQLVPCFASTAAADYGYQFALEFDSGGKTQRAFLDPIGALPPRVQTGGRGQAESSVDSDIDLFAVKAPLSSAVLHLSLWTRDSAAFQQAPALLSLSVRRAASPPPPESGPPAKVDLPVPPRSQRVLEPGLAARVCSPVSLSMVLEFYGRRAGIRQLIQRAHHAPSGLYGVWPAAVYAATRWGLLGYLLHFPSWEAARWLLDRGMPIIASVRYEEGELSRAAIARTSGHLLVLRGYEGSAVLVDDPAAPSAAQVARAYDLEEFSRIWLETSAIGYVLFPQEGVR